MYVAGVDSSTQSCKVVIVDASDGNIVRSGQAPHPPGTEVDPEEWWASLQQAILNAGGLGDVTAISIAAQQHGMVVLDGSGRVIRKALLWNDNRSSGAAQDLIHEVGPDEYITRTGLLPVASFTASKLRWLRDAEPYWAQQVAAVALPHDWLTWRLRGFGPENPDLAQLTTDRSDASGTAYWGPRGYDRDLFQLALGRDAVLPRVLLPYEVSGMTADGIVVGAGAGDNAAAALGLGVGDGEAVVSLGTSGTVFVTSPYPIYDRTGTIASFSSASGSYLPLVATLNAAEVLDSVARVLEVSHSEMANMALEANPGADGIVLIPWFRGERTPNLPQAKASFSGLTAGNFNRANLARAAYEGMLCGLAAGVDSLKAEGLNIERLLLVGGAADNCAIQNIASQIFPMPVGVPVKREYAAYGAARQAYWVIEGRLPKWHTPLELVREVEEVSKIRERYMNVAAKASSFYRQH